MNEALTERQTQILKAIIDEYVETAEAVGSQILENKYDLGISSATIRNEMVKLTELGYFRQPHTSAGRMPTPKAMKFYIDQLMEEKQMSLTDEVKTKEEVWDLRDNVDDLIEGVTHVLADKTGSLAVATLDNGKTWHAGLASIFRNMTFVDLAICANIFSFLEEASQLDEIFFQRLTGEAPVEVIFGEDLGWPGFEPVGILATRFNVRNQKGALGIVGPAAVSYPTVIPILRYFGGLIEELANK